MQPPDPRTLRRPAVPAYACWHGFDLILVTWRTLSSAGARWTPWNHLHPQRNHWRWGRCDAGPAGTGPGRPLRVRGPGQLNLATQGNARELGHIGAMGQGCTADNHDHRWSAAMAGDQRPARDQPRPGGYPTRFHTAEVRGGWRRGGAASTDSPTLGRWATRAENSSRRAGSGHPGGSSEDPCPRVRVCLRWP
jgi:hypothetical protein